MYVSCRSFSRCASHWPNNHYTGLTASNVYSNGCGRSHCAVPEEARIINNGLLATSSWSLKKNWLRLFLCPAFSSAFFLSSKPWQQTMVFKFYDHQGTIHRSKPVQKFSSAFYDCLQDIQTCCPNQTFFIKSQNKQLKITLSKPKPTVQFYRNGSNNKPILSISIKFYLESKAYRQFLTQTQK